MGGAWLKLLVLGIVYYFGIKQGIGAESLEEFLKAIRLEPNFKENSNSAARQRLDYESAQSTYHQTLHAITQGIHPFNLTTGNWQLWQKLELSLDSQERTVALPGLALRLQ